MEGLGLCATTRPLCFGTFPCLVPRQQQAGLTCVYTVVGRGPEEEKVKRHISSEDLDYFFKHFWVFLFLLLCEKSRRFGY